MLEIFSTRAHSFPINNDAKPKKLPIKQLAALLLLTYPMTSMAVLPDQLSLNVGDIDNDGKDEVLVLEKRSMRSPTGHKLMTWDSSNGYQQITPPEVRTYRGHVQDDISMRVNANIEPGNKTMNANLSDGHDINIRLTAIPVTIKGASGTKDPGNGNKVVPLTANRSAPTKNGYIVPVHTMRRLDYAVAIDNTYFRAMDSNIEASVARVEQRMNDTDFFYARDMGLAHEINWMIVDLEEHDVKWKKEWYNVHRPNGAVFEVATMFKKAGGAGAGGDVFKNAFHTTGTTAAYSKSQGHELGHNLGAGHYSSWSDAMSGSSSALGSGTVERMIGNAHIATEAQSPELHYSSPLPPFAMEDGISMLMNTSKDIDVLENDYDGNGDAISISYVDATTKKGGKAEIVNDKVRYTPPTHWQGVDEFTYHVKDSTGIANRQGYVKVAVHNKGLASHYTFDEQSGTRVNDIGPFQAHGKLTDNLSFSKNSSGGSVTGKIGNALARDIDESFNKVSADFWGIGDPLNGDLSVSLWVKFHNGAPSDKAPIIGKGGAVIRNRFGSPRGGWDIGHTKDGRFRFEGNLNRDSEYTYENAQFDLESNDKIKADTWYHLAMVMDRKSKKLSAWVNGKALNDTENGTSIANGIIDNSHHPMVIFDSISQQQQNEDFPITVDDVRIYYKPLTATEVKSLFKQEQNIAQAGAPKPLNAGVVPANYNTLSWLGNQAKAKQFDLYLSDNFAQVSKATTNSKSYQGRITGNNYQSNISEQKRHYWRVDSIVDNKVIKGDVWWFDVSVPTTLGLAKDPLVNNSFEITSKRKEKHAGKVYGWLDADKYVFTSNETKQSYPNTPYGSHWAELGKKRWLYQQIGTYRENMTLDISFLLGRSKDRPGLATQVSLYAGGDPELIADKNLMMEENPLMQTVGAKLIAKAKLIPAMSRAGTKEYQLTLSTGKGFQPGTPLWLQISSSDAKGKGKLLIDNIRVIESNVQRL